LSDQPERRLHSQLDHSPYSRAGKVSGREPIYINTLDAEQRAIKSGDLVLVHNDRGRSLAGALVTDDMMPGVVRLATGSWYDRSDEEQTNAAAFDNNANPNSLTLDRGASSFSQGCSAQTCLVEVERFVGGAPPVSVYELPELIPPQ
jgi:biotin/methionine sulfoxide reductase